MVLWYFYVLSHIVNFRFNCQKVRVDRLAYNKDMAPVEKFSNDKRTPVELSLTDFEIVEIDYLKSEFVARFTLHMKWRDGRITFLNLRQDQNILDQDDISKFLFVNKYFD